jgi:two-component system NtrC family sensor kinase
VQPELLLDEQGPKISADAELLSKGFENVLENSLNAMPMGGTLTIRTTPQNEFVRVEISDTGSGLEAEPRIPGVPFAAKLQGAGLGLATIQSVVSDHGGYMYVETMPSGGTTFRMDFPIAQGTLATPEDSSAAGGSRRAASASEERPEPATSKPSLARTMNI